MSPLVLLATSTFTVLLPLAHLLSPSQLGKVMQLSDLSKIEDVVTSVAWSEGGGFIWPWNPLVKKLNDCGVSNQKLIQVIWGHSVGLVIVLWVEMVL